MTNQLILIGGGWSINEGISMGLWEKIQNNFTIGCNFVGYMFIPNILCFVDEKFGVENEEMLSKMPMVLTVDTNYKAKKQYIKLKTNHNKYTRDLSKGVYKSWLTGVWALSISIYLLEEGEIFLLGMDGKAFGTDSVTLKNLTHFYQTNRQLPTKITLHEGVGRDCVYQHVPKDPNSLENLYKPFKNESKIKIWNVSPNSNIPYFEKITYNKFFKKLHPEPLNSSDINAFAYLKLVQAKDK